MLVMLLNVGSGTYVLALMVIGMLMADDDDEGTGGEYLCYWLSILLVVHTVDLYFCFQP